ncbi:Predicted ATPase [Leclercia adecarboxylata]|uniref:Predicted ATPase n=1 Tax=Leclercia adecarboxylata TaxID=83655 RepID=A0A4U9HYN5_9ENTR|nr:Predicted ATPase [Leclercia adecarboxylata]
MAGAPALQFFPWPDVDAFGESKLAQADKQTNVGMLRERFNYYCEKVVKGFYTNHFFTLRPPDCAGGLPAAAQQRAAGLQRYAPCAHPN